MHHLRDLANEPNWEMTCCCAQLQCAGLHPMRWSAVGSEVLNDVLGHLTD